MQAIQSWLSYTGVRVAEAATQAAVTTLSEVEYGIAGGRDRGAVVSNSKDTGSIDGKLSDDREAVLNEAETALMEANSMLEKEELDIEKAVSEIVEVQLKDIHNKIIRFEELDLLMERERQQFDEMKHMLFVDQLSLLSRRKSVPKMADSSKQNL
ncbi:hypothetical protein MLD38_000842 [Melastoma candidum]|uniref:Uncharacterized protein n=1 Tax=Melastoma candidum TaxID=119954 RepID=A0ACB9SEP9_9MYRT|nr:hypothetical protein MLD38_000842 [Melastoma candidum]